MTVEVSISASAREWLGQRESGSWGWLVGVRQSASQICVLSAMCGGEQYVSEASDLAELLPVGLKVLGMFCHSDDGDLAGEGKRVLSDKGGLYSSVLQAMGTASGSAHLVAVAWGGEVLLGVASPSSGDVAPVTPKEVEGDSWVAEALVALRLVASISFSVAAEKGAGQAALKERLALLEQELTSEGVALLAPAPVAAQQQQQHHKKGGGGGKGAGGKVGAGGAAASGARLLTARSPPGDVCGQLGGEGGSTAPVKLSLMISGSERSSAAQSPVLAYLPNGSGSGAGADGPMQVQVEVEVDAMCLAPRAMPVGELVGKLAIPGLRAHLRAALGNISAASAITSARALHYSLPNWPHTVGVIYALPAGEVSSADEKALESKRRCLHKRLGLPLNRPAVRVAGAVDLDAGAASGRPAASSSGRLQDVHVGLGPSHVSGGQLYLVQGSYEYFHYMQDRFDDAGWGCAYRSLQTIVSWFRMQHYTTAPVPSHREIQQRLVRMGDKPSSFVGTSQWIGAIELGMLLDDILDVTYKVMALSSGADIPTKGRELAQHFATQGTPIMIGGGLLAYTLLGVDFNELTGDVSFLILDPHYTGGEDLKTIQGQKWVAWKKGPTSDGAGDIFDRNSFYNLLMPQRPTEI